nr:immunoglobulin heavy chain junction region [Macaca mulatta]MOV47676.1 immunoglobulin heavy chain junction region [Macaca mulatta]MOV47715.1 immunoglobulin heavy chain junction region [Macaca mulatta]MOV47732.1 immunoglobulin heavy chain junction region [Macaca mulatta]MOV47754.1 immunoglobulin heavy chain junction region [Macaca mulatta]
CVRVDSNFDYW